jgi:hypothetical protein
MLAKDEYSPFIKLKVSLAIARQSNERLEGKKEGKKEGRKEINERMNECWKEGRKE